jgi:very-short-patch-repair endonuclease
LAILEFARELRSKQTDAEAALWFRLRAHRFLGLHFRRQKPIGNYIVDFYCKEQNLVIEVDGSQHQDSPDDVERDAWLNTHGLKVLRFWNNDVLTSLDSVLEQVRLSLSPPLGEGGPKGRERA